MTKLMPYIVIGVLIVGTVFMISGRLKTRFPNRASQQEGLSGSSPSAVPVSEVNLETKTDVDNAVDVELGQLEQELSGINTNDFDAGGLSDNELGLE